MEVSGTRRLEGGMIGDERDETRRPPFPPESQPHLRRAWLRLFGGEDANLARVEARRQRRVAIPLAQFIQLPIASSRILSSRNWSGGSIVPHGGQQVVLMFGEWVVPEPTPPPHADQRITSGKYACSTWIGFDGDRRYVNSSLPQIGTEQWLDVATGVAHYDAFFQWWSFWEPDPKQFIYRLPELSIAKGATIVAMLWAVDPFTVVAAMGVFGSEMQLFEEEFTAPLIALPGPTMSYPRISGATAEWIVERPLDEARQPMAFPDYGKVDFGLCVAGTAPAPGVATAEEVLGGPRLLRMFETPGNAPSRTRMISHARRTSSTSLHVQYGSLR